MELLRQTIAYVFKRKGKQAMSVQDFIFSLAMDLHWFSPEECKKLIDICIRSKVLVKSGEELIPNFDFESVFIPLEFKPSRDILEYKKDLFLDVVSELERKTKLEKHAIIAEINKLQADLDVELEVAALLVARKYELEIANYLKPIEKLVEERAKK